MRRKHKKSKKKGTGEVLMPLTLRFGSGMIGAGAGIVSVPPPVAPIGAISGWFIGDRLYKSGEKRFWKAAKKYHKKRRRKK